MTEEKKPSTANNSGLVQSNSTGAIKIGTKKSTPLWARDKQVTARQDEEKKSREALAGTMPNRIVLMLDVSPSMDWGVPGSTKTRIELLQLAFQKFIESVDFSNTSIGVETFPATTSIPLSVDQQMLMAQAIAIQTRGGGTPMGEAMRTVHEREAFSRGLIISDGQANGYYRPESEADAYRDSETPVDCVHIGDATDGEETLKTVAEKTGGIYIKFKDVEAFARSLAYLSPRHRAMLTSGQVGAAELGASEIKYLGGK